MDITLESVVAAALTLPPEERWRLAQTLMALDGHYPELDEPGGSGEPEQSRDRIEAALAELPVLAPLDQLRRLEELAENHAHDPHALRLIAEMRREVTADNPAATVGIAVERLARTNPLYLIGGALGATAMALAAGKGLWRLIF
jgi:hypothetical protein